MNKTKLNARHESNAAMAGRLAHRLVPFATDNGPRVCDVAYGVVRKEIASQLDQYGRFNPNSFSVSVGPASGLCTGDQYAAMCVIESARDLAAGSRMNGTPVQIARELDWIDRRDAAFAAGSAD